MATTLGTPSSPRLPSPPPTAEIQLGPRSPGPGAVVNQQAQQMEQIQLRWNEKRRIHPGSKSADMPAGPPLVPLGDLDSAFQLQEHLAALHYSHTNGNTRPLDRNTSVILATPPPAIDKTLWLYELCRFLTAHCNSLIVGFLFDSPPCSAATCPEMRASEWQFLCAVHDQPKSCCAIDYCCHTLDWAANVVTNPKIFPSRFVAPGSEGPGPGGMWTMEKDRAVMNNAVKNLVNVFRRLHRIFAHAWFQHRGVFWSVEGQTGLYVFFKTVCDGYDLLPAENYKLPPEAEGLEDVHKDESLDDMSGSRRDPRIQIQQPPPQQSKAPALPTPAVILPMEEPSLGGAQRVNTRRHTRSSPSTGSAVTTVDEAEEEDTLGGSMNKMRDLHITAPETVEEEEEAETADVPVIVDHGLMEDSGNNVPASAPKDTFHKEQSQGEAAEPVVTVSEMKSADTNAAKVVESEPSSAVSAPQEVQEEEVPETPVADIDRQLSTTASEDDEPLKKDEAALTHELPDTKSEHDSAQPGAGKAKEKTEEPTKEGHAAQVEPGSAKAAASTESRAEAALPVKDETSSDD